MKTGLKVSIAMCTYNGEKYKYFTSSAGQIRKKKAVFIKESVWNKIEKTIMCGLTIDKINSKGGNNVNKHLAYMALSNSATDEWEEFDIDKSIVIDDFETNVYGTFDFVDETDYSITRKTDYVPIPHTDGAGMVLPSLSTKNFMFRSPWVKGLLGVFDFRKFIEVNNYSPVIYDIYGKEHNIIEEDIQIIFTKSQFKMAKFYDSWDEYKDAFKKYHCSAGRCNIEEDRIKNAKINYQMLQTLTNITDDEIDLLTNKSVKRISDVCSSKETMMDILGITPYNTNMTPFQKAVKMYPALLSDTYAKDVIREVKNSLLKKYRSGKLEVTGKYTFLLPDYYAACEYWFGHIEEPKGLLDDKEVFCWLFKQYDKLDCLRSPHLYKEHAIRFNVASNGYGERVDQIREWFTTNAVYTSTHDLISKILQFDVDGDKSLVVADKDFVRIAERNMNGIVPLYYNMRKAEPTQLNNKNIYAGLNAAFTGGNIGIYSNNISKIWNSDVFVNGSDEEKQEAIDVVKLLCMENNFVIDEAKTLYKPTRPQHLATTIKRYTNRKVPYFFIYAKDKDPEQVEKINNSTVNRICKIIPDKKITYNKTIGKFDYQMLMNRDYLDFNATSEDCYGEFRKIYKNIMLNSNFDDCENKNEKDIWAHISIKTECIQFCNAHDIPIPLFINIIISKLYNTQAFGAEKALWAAFGRQIVKNIINNTAQLGNICPICGARFNSKTTNNQMYCSDGCYEIMNREKTRLRMANIRKG